MPFNEAIKLEVKTKAHFKCCVCNSFEFIEVHHIIPQSEQGPDTIENAAPLCVRCHDNYGNNPDKRKWIREKRDFWFEHCREHLTNENIEQLEKTHAVFVAMHDEMAARVKNAEQRIGTLQATVEQLSVESNKLIKKISTVSFAEKPVIFAQIGSAANTISGAATAMATTMTQLGPGIYANTCCSKCGHTVGLQISNISGPPFCPACKSQMY